MQRDCAIGDLPHLSHLALLRAKWRLRKGAWQENISEAFANSSFSMYGPKSAPFIVQYLRMRRPRCSPLLCVQFVEPVFHVAEGAEEVEAGLGQVERGVERILVFLALVYAGKLFGFGGQLGLGVEAGLSAVA